MDFESLDLFGAPFEHVETYVYYQGRRTFAMRSKAWRELYYLVNTVDEDDETGDLTTLVVAVNEDRFRAIRSGTVPFRDAFSSASDHSASVVLWSFDEQSQTSIPMITPTNARDIPARWLPVEGLRLSLPTQTVEPFQQGSLVALSRAQSRTIFAVEVESSGARITEFPVRYAGELQSALDGEIIALGREHAPEGMSVAREIRPAVLAVQAASFVIVMAIDTPGALVEQTDLTASIFDDLNNLMNAVGSGSEEQFLEELKKHGSRVRNRFRDILTPLSAVGSGIALSSVVAFSNDVVRTWATAENVRTAVHAIEAVVPTVTTVKVDRGILLGLNVRTQRFELVDDATAINYAGYMTDEAHKSANGLVVGDESYVVARIRVEVPFASEDETAGTKYFLTSIGPYVAPDRALST